MAVVKADAYGHGDVEVARTALEAGATWLGVALVEEGIRLRDHGVSAPVLVLSEFPPGTEASAFAAGLTPVLYSADGLRRLAKAARDLGGPMPAVHVKVDTGMHRVGSAASGAAGVRDADGRGRVAARWALDAPRVFGGGRRDDEGAARPVLDRGRGRPRGRAPTRSPARRQHGRFESFIRRRASISFARGSASMGSSPHPVSVRPSTFDPRSHGAPPSRSSGGSPRESGSAMATATNSRGTRGSRPCRSGTPTGTLGWPPRAPTS